MQSILIRSEAAVGDLLISELWEQGTIGLLDEAGGVRAFFEDSADLNPILAEYQESITEHRTEQPVDWQCVSREGWEPMLVGERFFVVPSWLDQPTPPGRVRLIFDSIMAFGTGRHESTQLVLEALEKHLRPGQTVVDIGCGTGILSIAAEMLGAGRVAACDLNENSAKEAQLRLSSRVFVGSVHAVRTACADIVVSNISCAVIEEIGSELRRIAKPDGTIIVAGFIADRMPRGFNPQQAESRNEWVCWVCKSG